MMVEAGATIGVEIQQRKLASILASHEISANVYPVEEKGFVVDVRDKTNLSTRPHNLLVVDLDDTIIRYKESKDRRAALYRCYLFREGVAINRRDLGRIMKATDEFARYNEGGVDTHYHIGAHLSSLTWVTQELLAHKESPTEAVNWVQEELNRVKNTAHGEKGDISDLVVQRNGSRAPFAFKNDRLVLAGKQPWNREIYEIFEDSIINAPAFEQMIDLLRQMGDLQTRGDDYFLPVILTYGKPDFQLVKILQFLKEERITIPFFWLTNVPKGKFLASLVASANAADFGFPAQDEKEMRMIVVDDDPHMLDDIASYANVLAQSHVVVEPVRVRHPGTKNYDQSWYGWEVNADTSLADQLFGNVPLPVFSTPLRMTTSV